MTDSKNPHIAYASIIQYVPDLERTEGANIGIILFSPESGYFKYHFSTGNRRVQRFFKIHGDDLIRFKAIKEAFHQRISLESQKLKSLQDFQQFIDTRGNQIILTAPRPLKVYEPQAEIEALFQRLVGGRRTQKESERAAIRQRLIRKFDESVAAAGIQEKVQRQIQLDIPQLDRHITFPYGFQNGVPNVIRIESFGENSENNYKRVCILGIEGREIHEHMNTTVHVIAHLSANNPDIIKHVLAQQGVKFWSSNEIDTLVEEIKEKGH